MTRSASAGVRALRGGDVHRGRQANGPVSTSVPVISRLAVWRSASLLRAALRGREDAAYGTYEESRVP